MCTPEIGTCHSQPGSLGRWWRQPGGGARTASLGRPDRGEAEACALRRRRVPAAPGRAREPPSPGRHPGTAPTGPWQGPRKEDRVDAVATARVGDDTTVRIRPGWRRAISPAGVPVFRGTSGALPCPGTGGCEQRRSGCECLTWPDRSTHPIDVWRGRREARRRAASTVHASVSVPGLHGVTSARETGIGRQGRGPPGYSYITVLMYGTDLEGGEG